jgi:DNA-binding transcriptional LysR family regulator
VLSPRVWRLSHLGAKLAFLRAGLGFGIMPLHLVEVDLANGALVRITTEDASHGGHLVAMSAVYRTDTPPGPAGRWFIERLKQEDVQPPILKASRTAALTSASSMRRRSPSRSGAARRQSRTS